MPIQDLCQWIKARPEKKVVTSYLAEATLRAKADISSFS